MNVENFTHSSRCDHVQHVNHYVFTDLVSILEFQNIALWEYIVRGEKLKHINLLT